MKTLQLNIEMTPYNQLVNISHKLTNVGSNDNYLCYFLFLITPLQGIFLVTLYTYGNCISHWGSSMHRFEGNTSHTVLYRYMRFSMHIHLSKWIHTKWGLTLHVCVMNNESAFGKLTRHNCWADNVPRTVWLHLAEQDPHTNKHTPKNDKHGE